MRECLLYLLKALFRVIALSFRLLTFINQEYTTAKRNMAIALIQLLVAIRCDQKQKEYAT